MFDKPIVIAGFPGKHHHTTTVNVEAPSAADSARLLKQLEDQAAERIKDVLVSQVPAIKAHVLTYKIERDLCSATVHQHAAFSINGEEFDVDLTTPEYEAEDRSLAFMVIKVLCEEIARKLTDQCLPEIARVAQR